MKRITALVVAAVWALSITASAAAQWAPPLGTPDTVGISFVDSFSTTGEQASKVSSIIRTDQFGGMPEEVLCESIGVGECNFANEEEFHAAGNLILPTCKDSAQENCLEALSITENGQTFSASFVRQAAGPEVDGDDATGLPAGSTVSLWSLPDSYEGSMSKDVAVYASIGIVGFYKGKFILGRFSTNVVPVDIQSSSKYKSPEVVGEVAENGRRFVGTRNVATECTFTEDGICASPQDFPANVRVSLSIRLTNTIGGWFQGRMKDTTISIAKFSKNANLVTVAGEPVEVPTIGFAIPQISAPAGFVDTIKEQSKGWVGGVVNTNVGNSRAWTLLPTIRTILQDSASGVVRVWNFGSTSALGNACLVDTSKVLGIVTTNSSLYQTEAPRYSKGFLDYKVAGMHYLPDGETVFEGSYDLVMRSEVARCLYGFSKAPVSATISVTGTGDKSVATTVVSEKNGWLKLAAYGFTFSEKTLKVKLTQKKTTITCVSKTNKKKTKKVTGYSPKCPTGYKKK